MTEFAEAPFATGTVLKMRTRLFVHSLMYRLTPSLWMATGCSNLAAVAPVVVVAISGCPITTLAATPLATGMVL